MYYIKNKVTGKFFSDIEDGVPVFDSSIESAKKINKFSADIIMGFDMFNHTNFELVKVTKNG